MSRILLIGHNPPHFEGHSKVEAAHYRTWQFLEPLLVDQHSVCLCADSLNTSNGRSSPPEGWAGQLEYHALPFRRELGWVGQLQQIHDAFEPDCILAVNFDGCLCATTLRTEKPIWMDIYGDYLTIIQAICYRQGSDRGIPTSIQFVQRVLQRGDIFSVCSTPQRHALVGELAMAGRLNWRTFGYEFSRVVLPGSPPGDTQTEGKGERPLLSSQDVPKAAFVVLWCGGYNTWTDVETLFTGLEWAMERDPQIHYVSVGASTYGTPDNVYSRLLAMIEQSEYQDRFHMLGWRPWTEIADYYRESDVGLNIDAQHYETTYGTRTRLVEMIASGLPVITSLGSELSALLDQQGAGLTFVPGDQQGLGKQILTLAKDDHLCSQMAHRALSYARHELSFAATTAPVRAWVREPQLAPDKAPADFQKRLQQFEYQARATLRQAIWRLAGLDRR
jgi:glycosyltransferase involved in cell wall biosynthesis